jgi:hypothetical protein
MVVKDRKCITKKYVTVSQLSELQPAFPKAWIKNMVRKRDENGLSVAVAKVGRRIFIDYDAFMVWVDSHANGDMSDENIG